MNPDTELAKAILDDTAKTNEIFNSYDAEKISKKIKEFVSKIESKNGFIPVYKFMEFFENECKKDPKFIRFLVMIYVNAAKMLGQIKKENKEIK